MKLTPMRQFAIAFLGTTVAVSAAWFLPGATGRGFSSLLAQAAPAAGAPAAVAAPAVAAVSIIGRLTGLIGIALIIALAYAMSHRRSAIKWRIVGVGTRAPVRLRGLRAPGAVRCSSSSATSATSSPPILHYLLRGLAPSSSANSASPDSTLGVIFAFQILPAIIFISALFAILYYLGVMQVVVRACAVAMTRLLGASGAESLNVARVASSWARPRRR